MPTFEYELQWTDDQSGTNPLKPRFTVNPNVVNGPGNIEEDTPLQLPGKFTPNYGIYLHTSMIHMLENFAGPIEPPNMTSGMVWFDTTADGGNGIPQVRLTDNIAWQSVAIGQPVRPTDDVTFDDVLVTGNLTVQGTTTEIESNIVNIGDSIITLNSDEVAAPSQDAGFEIERGTSPNVQFVWDETADRFKYHIDGTGTGTFFLPNQQLDTTSDVSFNSVTASLTGNADTATALQTSRSFDITGDITAPAQGFDGTANVTIPATVDVSTKLRTSRLVDISGDITATAQSFDGTTNISIPATVDVSTKLRTIRTFTLSGDVDGSVENFDGTGNVDITATLVGGASGSKWQDAPATPFTAVAGDNFFIDTSGGVVTATLPPSPSEGDTVGFNDATGTWDTNSLFVNGNGENIMGAGTPLENDVQFNSFRLAFSPLYGWRIII